MTSAVRTPRGPAVLAALDTGAEAGELGQVLALLQASGIETPEDLTMGDGDRHLLDLHRRLTHRDVEVAVKCTECSALNAAVLAREALPETAPRVASLGPGAGLRQPRYCDLVELPRGPGEAEAELLRRCTLGTPPRAATSEDLEGIDESLTGPIALVCAECGAALAVGADVERLVLESLQRHAGKVELEVHLLARAYGWSLATIESLPDERRQRLAGLVEEGR